MNIWRYNPDNYNIGDKIWVCSPYGWSNYKANYYLVTRKTPTGQITAKREDREIRFTKNGSIVGGGIHDRNRVCSEEQAVALNKEAKERDVWLKIAELCRAIEVAARRQDAETFDAALKGIVAARGESA